MDQNWLQRGESSPDRFQYAYDANSNVLYRDNLVNKDFGELYQEGGAGASTLNARGGLAYVSRSKF